ncbi:MAG: GNAT family N-acetyltransferase [Patescibacteria group bacterium]
MTIKFEDRDMTGEEYKREQVAFDEHGMEFGNPPDKSERYGFVATDNGKFVGCSSGLAQKPDNNYCKYFYLSDLLVEKEYRKLGYGKKLLDLLEEKIKSLGIEYIWTWTAEYEASTFYQKQGYKIFTEFDNFYKSGHSRVGLIKKL